MQRINSKQLCDALEEAGHEPESYSGRAMYGKTCVSVTVDSDADLWRLSAQLARDVSLEVPAPTLDNLGRQVVAYWPTLAWEEKPSAIQAALKAAGFAEWHTGGGCMALALRLNDAVHILATDCGGADLPTDSSWFFGVYDDAEHCEGINYGPPEHPGFSAALKLAIAKAEELAGAPVKGN